MASIVTPIVMFLVGRYNLDGRLVNLGRASSVGRALDCRVGGRGLKGHVKWRSVLHAVGDVKECSQLALLTLK